MDPYVERILKARVYDVAIESPLQEAPKLSRRVGARVLLKREDLQPVFSFKLRGAHAKIAALTPEEGARGVLTASAGNHAQGVALAARRRGLRAVIVMPRTTPTIKVEAVRALGGEVVLHGDDYDAAAKEARRLADAQGLTYVHPFDDPDVIAGQGTIGIELLRQLQEPPAVVFVPVGGGGLIAGVATYLKSLYPQIRVVGVEPTDAAGMHASLAAGHVVTLERVGLFADGVAVRRVGDETFRLARQYVDEIVLCDTDAICAAIQAMFEETRSIVEPAGALAVAGLVRWCADHEVSPESTLVALTCGANMNFDRLRHVAERADLGAGREALFAVEIPERVGSFLDFARLLGMRSITEFNYRYSHHAQARIFVGVALDDPARGRQELMQLFQSADLPVTDLSDDETAKLHVRYMVGGRAPSGLTDERLFRFEFPERPGALLGFLEAIGARFNVSLFHYRNHGSDHGRVLCGIQVPSERRAELAEHLSALGYAFRDETDNPAYRLFL